jgi:MipA family protein
MMQVRAFSAAAGIAVLLAATPLRAAGLTVDVIPNFVGGGVGVTTEWMGSKDSVFGLVPGGRVKFSSHRFAELYGPLMDVNVLDVPNWEFGPMLNYRFGRKDVEDPVVNLLPPIEGGWEAGVFVGYNYTNAQGIPWRLRLGVSATTAVSGGATGGHVTPYGSLWVPLSRTVFVGFGGGFTWSSASFMQQRFGVTPAASAASGLPEFSAGADVRQVYAWPAVLVRLSDHWYGGAGAFYQRLTGGAANSPIVAQRGDRDQWTAGVGLGYGWQ